MKTGHDINLKKELKVIFAIRLGFFLVLFFMQPYDLLHFKIEEQILFYSVIAGIAFLSLTLFHVILPKAWPKIFKKTIWEIDSADFASFFIWVFIGISMVFFLRYVGKIDFTIYTVFKTALMALAPIAVLNSVHKIKKLMYQISELQKKIKNCNTGDETQKKRNNSKIELFSENKTDMIKVSLYDLILIRSADNYVEVMHKDREKISTSILRKTLKSVEKELFNEQEIIRCHRTCLVNKMHIERLSKNYGGYQIKIKGMDNLVPLSRQYLLSVKASVGLL